MASPKWRETFHRLTTETVNLSNENEAEPRAKEHKRPLHGGRLDEVQSLVWHWLLTPEDACRIVDFPIEHYREWDADRGEPAYLPSPDEIARVSLLIATGKLIQHPSRYFDEDRGREMWERVHSLAIQAESQVEQIA
ncbi:hypothetical protein [Rhodopirellula europaea]|uniref:hypothetical protein n=1 Tax=Rhodopirellula europaea TaxID=1263866 RepID=UPI003D2E28A0